MGILHVQMGPIARATKYQFILKKKVSSDAAEDIFKNAAFWIINLKAFWTFWHKNSPQNVNFGRIT